MRESRTYGSVRGARGNSRPYRVRELVCCDCSQPLVAHSGSDWLRELIPLTGVKQTAMLRRGNACN